MGYILTMLSNIFTGLGVSMGGQLTISTGGIFFMGFPVAYAVGAYSLIICQKAGLDLFTGIFISIILILVCGLLFAYAYIKLSNESFAVLSLSSILALDAVLRSWDSVTGGVLGISGIVRPAFISNLSGLVGFQFIFVMILLIFEFLLLKTRFGRNLRALKENPTVLNSYGTSPYKIGSAIIILTCILAGTSSFFEIWRIQFLDPGFGGITILISSLTIAIIAARPRISWLIVATIFVFLLP